jgi:hypothetical protein
MVTSTLRRCDLRIGLDWIGAGDGDGKERSEGIASVLLPGRSRGGNRGYTCCVLLSQCSCLEALFACRPITHRQDPFLEPECSPVNEEYDVVYTLQQRQHRPCTQG